MRSNIFSAFARKSLLAVQGAALLCVLATLAHAAPQSKQTAMRLPRRKCHLPRQSRLPKLSSRRQAGFDVPALLKILGPDGEDLVSSEDPVRDKNAAVAFAAKAREKNAVVVDPKNSKRATLSVGDDDFPFAIPIVQKKGKWYFDTKAGRQEILFRRIGENELDAITICRGFVEAQKEYARADP